jgi:hypothetical protein
MIAAHFVVLEQNALINHHFGEEEGSRGGTIAPTLRPNPYRAEPGPTARFAVPGPS